MQNTDFFFPIWELETGTKTISGDKVGAHLLISSAFISQTQLNEHAKLYSSPV